MAEPSFLTAVRESYDTVAADYVERVPPPAEMDPLSRAMLAGFAELVRTAGLGPVADLGCGPGRVTAHLAGLGCPSSASICRRRWSGWPGTPIRTCGSLRAR